MGGAILMPTSNFPTRFNRDYAEYGTPLQTPYELLEWLVTVVRPSDEGLARAFGRRTRITGRRWRLAIAAQGK